MPTKRTCPECGKPLQSETAGGLCPECLLRRGLDQTVQTEPAQAGARSEVSAPVAMEAASEASPPSNAPRPGGQFGAYRIIRLLGRGGMGEVFEADHLETGRRVALKVMSHSLASTTDEKRFLREGRLAASVSHPNVVYVYGSEEIDGVPVIAMELVQGGTLKEQVRKRGPLPVREGVDAILEIISGLEAAHATGVLHRDIKPANCFVAPDGRVKVGDFGLSISTLARGESMLTASGSVLGTPSFASPEQLRGESLDVASDIYSVGATLFYLLTGKPPHDAPDLVRLITEVLDRAPEPPTKLRPELPKGLSRVMMRCLAKSRADRYASYSALREALLPYSSSGASPATLGLRFVAGLIDLTIACTPELTFAALTGWDTVSYLAYERSPVAALVAMGSLLWAVLYFAIPEGLWGASLGKALCRLRVVNLSGHFAGFGPAFVRALAFLAISWLPYVIQALFLSREALREVVLMSDWNLSDILSIPLLAFLFVTMRRANGFAALHDLISRTRVILKAATPAREKIRLPRSAAKSGGLAAPEAEPHTISARLGPYAVVGSLGRFQGAELLLGYDEVLRRHIWIVSQRPGAPAVSARRRDLSRPGRLRWLNGQRLSSERAWDAYEAVEGWPLLELPPQSWGVVRYWLLDLAEELYAGQKDDSLPSQIGLDHVWITAGGRAVLLDFPHPRVSNQAEPLSRQNVSDVSSTQALLDEAARYCLERRYAAGAPPRKTPPATAKESYPTPPLPMHARPFLEQLRARAFEAVEILLANLRSLVNKPATISRQRRLLTLALPPLLLMCTITFAMIFDYVKQQRFDRFWEEQYGQGPSLRRALQTYHVFEYDTGVFGDAEDLRRLFKMYIADAFRALAHEAGFWQRSEVRAVLSTTHRDILRDAVSAHPSIAAEDLAAAKALAEPMLRKVRTEERRGYIWYGAGLTGGLIFFWGLLAIFISLLFRSVVLLQLTGVLIVARTGRRASRLRMAWRSFVGWLPWMVFGMAVLQAAYQEPWVIGLGYEAGQRGFILAAIISGGIGLAGTFSALVRPERGLHDRLAGTWLVAR